MEVCHSNNILANNQCIKDMDNNHPLQDINNNLIQEDLNMDKDIIDY